MKCLIPLAEPDISYLDVTWIQEDCAGIISLSNEQALRADMNGDGKVSVLDATHLQRKILEGI